MGGMYKDLAKRAEYQRQYNLKRKAKYQAKKREKMSGLPKLLPSGRYPFYWEQDLGTVANPALDCYTCDTSSSPP